MPRVEEAPRLDARQARAAAAEAKGLAALMPKPGDVVVIGPLAMHRQDFVPVTVRVISVEPEAWDPTRAVLHGLILRSGGRVVGKLIATVHLPYVQPPA